jgi:hypothetical protein
MVGVAEICGRPRDFHGMKNRLEDRQEGLFSG